MTRIFSPRVLGVLFICLLMLGVWLTYAVFTKKFSDYEEVTLKTSTIGLQLPARADVKIRGVLVGEVLERNVADGGQGAEIVLGIYPEKIGVIPADVTGAIVPKTLFGEKYVSLVIPDSGGAGTLRANTVIDRTVVSTELEQVLADLFPLLRTVQPADLNMTLTAMATALEGRGDALGDNLETLDSYLKRMNPQIPALLEDLKLAAEVSDVYADILPDVAQILEDSVKTMGTFEEREPALTATLRDVRAFSDTARAFLDANSERLRINGQLSTKILTALARYSPTIPCLARGIVETQGRLADTFRGYELHIVLETLPTQPRHYTEKDRPRFGEDSGANCRTIPNTPFSQENPSPGLPDLDDGVDTPTGKGNARAATGFGYHGTPDDVSTLRTMLRERYDGRGSDFDVLMTGPLAAAGGVR